MRAFLAGAASLALAGCAQAGGEPQSAPLAGGTYVAMGSSMAAGPGLGQPKPGTPARCTRSHLNYPTLLAEELRLTLFDATCSGATTEHILGPWGEIPAQIEMVTAETDLVTITIGGNDINYVGNIMAASCPPGGKFEVAGRTFDCPKPTDPSEVDYAMLEDSLGRIAQEVRRRAPDAKIVFVEYLRLVPETPCANTPLSEEGAAATREIARRLALATRNAAKANGATSVPIHDMSADHTACGDKPWAVGNPADYDGNDGAPWHPNYAGMRAVADILAVRLKT